MVSADLRRTGRKRGNGEGNIRQRPNGLWEARLTLPNGTSKSLYAKTRKDVAEKLRAAVTSMRQGLPLPSGRVTLGQFAGQWLAEAVRPSTRATTYRVYEQMTRNHIVPALGKVRLTDLTPQRVQSFLNAKREEGRLSARSVQMLHEILRNMLGQAYRWDLVPRNPLTEKRVPTPRAPRRPVPVLTPDDARAVLDAVRGDRLEAIVTVGLALGMRQGEILGLTWEDVGFETGTVTVRHQLQRIGGVYQLVEPKSEESHRQLDLPSAVLNALRAHRVRQLEERLAAGVRWKGNDLNLVFETSVGTPLDGVKVTRRFQERLRRAGLPHLRFHDLRHGAASLLLAQGVHPRVVMQILGHSDIRLTLGTYSHVIPQLMQDAAAKMEAVLTGGSR
jgi:integrase